jgi:hypothetical protein
MNGRKQPKVFEGKQGEQGVSEGEKPVSKRSGSSIKLFEGKEEKKKETSLPQEVTQQM